VVELLRAAHDDDLADILAGGRVLARLTAEIGADHALRPELDELIAERFEHGWDGAAAGDAPRGQPAGRFSPDLLGVTGELTGEQVPAAAAAIGQWDADDLADVFLGLPVVQRARATQWLTHLSVLMHASAARSGLAERDSPALMIVNDVVDTLYADAIGRVRDAARLRLLTVPSQGGQAALLAALKPATPDAATLEPATLDPIAFGASLEKAYRRQIADYWSRLVPGKGKAEHADPANLYPMEDIGQSALLAKHWTDSLVGKFAEGPLMLPDVSGRRGKIHDLWADSDTQFEGMTFPEQREYARGELRQYLYWPGPLPSVLARFRVDPDFQEPSLAAKIVTATIDKLTGEPELVQQVLEIHAGGPGLATPSTGDVWVQRLRAATDERNEWTLWHLLKTLLHEYGHLLPDGAFRALPYDALQEGLTDLLARVVMRAHRHQFDDPKVRDRVLGDYAAAPPGERPHPSLSDYRSIAEARQVLHLLRGDIRPLLAAVYLGLMDRITGPGNGAAEASPRKLPTAGEVAALAAWLNGLPAREPTVVPVGPFTDEDATAQDIEELLTEPAADARADQRPGREHGPAAEDRNGVTSARASLGDTAPQMARFVRDRTAAAQLLPAAVDVGGPAFALAVDGLSHELFGGDAPVPLYEVIVYLVREGWIGGVPALGELPGLVARLTGRAEAEIGRTEIDAALAKLAAGGASPGLAGPGVLPGGAASAAGVPVIRRRRAGAPAGPDRDARARGGRARDAGAGDGLAGAADPELAEHVAGLGGAVFDVVWGKLVSGPVLDAALSQARELVGRERDLSVAVGGGPAGELTGLEQAVRRVAYYLRRTGDPAGAQAVARRLARDIPTWPPGILDRGQFLDQGHQAAGAGGPASARDVGAYPRPLEDLKAWVYSEIRTRGGGAEKLSVDDVEAVLRDLPDSQLYLGEGDERRFRNVVDVADAVLGRVRFLGGSRGRLGPGPSEAGPSGAGPSGAGPSGAGPSGTAAGPAAPPPAAHGGPDRGVLTDLQLAEIIASFTDDQEAGWANDDARLRTPGLGWGWDGTVGGPPQVPGRSADDAMDLDSGPEMGGDPGDQLRSVAGPGGPGSSGRHETRAGRAPAPPPGPGGTAAAVPRARAKYAPASDDTALSAERHSEIYEALAAERAIGWRAPADGTDDARARADARARTDEALEAREDDIEPDRYRLGGVRAFVEITREKGEPEVPSGFRHDGIGPAGLYGWLSDQRNGTGERLAWLHDAVRVVYGDLTRRQQREIIASLNAERQAGWGEHAAAARTDRALTPPVHEGAASRLEILLRLVQHLRLHQDLNPEDPVLTWWLGAIARGRTIPPYMRVAVSVMRGVDDEQRRALDELGLELAEGETGGDSVMGALLAAAGAGGPLAHIAGPGELRGHLAGSLQWELLGWGARPLWEWLETTAPLSLREVLADRRLAERTGAGLPSGAAAASRAQFVAEHAGRALTDDDRRQIVLALGDPAAQGFAAADVVLRVGAGVFDLGGVRVVLPGGEVTVLAPGEHPVTVVWLRDAGRWHGAVARSQPPGAGGSSPAPAAGPGEAAAAPAADLGDVLAGLLAAQRASWRDPAALAAAEQATRQELDRLHEIGVNTDPIDRAIAHWQEHHDLRVPNRGGKLGSWLANLRRKSRRRDPGWNEKPLNVMGMDWEAGDAHGNRLASEEEGLAGLLRQEDRAVGPDAREAAAAATDEALASLARRYAGLEDRRVRYVQLRYVEWLRVMVGHWRLYGRPLFPSAVLENILQGKEKVPGWMRAVLTVLAVPWRADPGQDVAVERTPSGLYFPVRGAAAAMGVTVTDDGLAEREAAYGFGPVADAVTVFAHSDRRSGYFVVGDRMLSVQQLGDRVVAELGPAESRPGVLILVSCHGNMRRSRDEVTRAARLARKTGMHVLSAAFDTLTEDGTARAGRVGFVADGRPVAEAARWQGWVLSSPQEGADPVVLSPADLTPLDSVLAGPALARGLGPVPVPVPAAGLRPGQGPGGGSGVWWSAGPARAGGAGRGRAGRADAELAGHVAELGTAAFDVVWGKLAEGPVLDAALSRARELIGREQDLLVADRGGLAGELTGLEQAVRRVAYYLRRTGDAAGAAAVARRLARDAAAGPLAVADRGQFLDHLVPSVNAEIRQLGGVVVLGRGAVEAALDGLPEGLRQHADGRPRSGADIAVAIARRHLARGRPVMMRGGSRRGTGAGRAGGPGPDPRLPGPGAGQDAPAGGQEMDLDSPPETGGDLSGPEPGRGVGQVPGWAAAVWPDDGQWAAVRGLGRDIRLVEPTGNRVEDALIASLPEDVRRGIGNAQDMRQFLAQFMKDELLQWSRPTWDSIDLNARWSLAVQRANRDLAGHRGPAGDREREIARRTELYASRPLQPQQRQDLVQSLRTDPLWAEASGDLVLAIAAAVLRLRIVLVMPGGVTRSFSDGEHLDGEHLDGKHLVYLLWLPGHYHGTTGTGPQAGPGDQLRSAAGPGTSGRHETHRRPAPAPAAGPGEAAAAPAAGPGEAAAAPAAGPGEAAAAPAAGPGDVLAGLLVAQRASWRDPVALAAAEQATRQELDWLKEVGVNTDPIGRAIAYWQEHHHLRVSMNKRDKTLGTWLKRFRTGQRDPGWNEKPLNVMGMDWEAGDAHSGQLLSEEEGLAGLLRQEDRAVGPDAREAAAAATDEALASLARRYAGLEDRRVRYVQLRYVEWLRVMVGHWRLYGRPLFPSAVLENILQGKEKVPGWMRAVLTVLAVPWRADPGQDVAVERTPSGLYFPVRGAAAAMGVTVTDDGLAEREAAYGFGPVADAVTVFAHSDRRSGYFVVGDRMLSVQQLGDRVVAELGPAESRPGVLILVSCHGNMRRSRDEVTRAARLARKTGMHVLSAAFDTLTEDGTARAGRVGFVADGRPVAEAARWQGWVLSSPQEGADPVVLSPADLTPLDSVLAGPALARGLGPVPVPVPAAGLRPGPGPGGGSGVWWSAGPRAARRGWAPPGDRGQPAPGGARQAVRVELAGEAGAPAPGVASPTRAMMADRGYYRAVLPRSEQLFLVDIPLVDGELALVSNGQARLASTDEVLELIGRDHYESRFLQFLAAPPNRRQYEVFVARVQELVDRTGKAAFVVTEAGAGVALDELRRAFVTWDRRGRAAGWRQVLPSLGGRRVRLVNGVVVVGDLKRDGQLDLYVRKGVSRRDSIVLASKDLAWLTEGSVARVNDVLGQLGFPAESLRPVRLVSEPAGPGEQPGPGAPARVLAELARSRVVSVFVGNDVSYDEHAGDLRARSWQRTAPPGDPQEEHRLIADERSGLLVPEEPAPEYVAVAQGRGRSSERDGVRGAAPAELPGYFAADQHGALVQAAEQNWMYGSTLVTFEPLATLGHSQRRTRRNQYRTYARSEGETQPSGRPTMVVVVGTNGGLPVRDDETFLRAAWAADAIRRLGLAGGPVRLLARPAGARPLNETRIRQWAWDFAKAIGAPVYYMTNAEFSPWLGDFPADYELLQPAGGPAGAVPPVYVADAVTGLLKLESLEANPLAGPDLLSQAEQDWRAVNGKVENLVAEPIREGRRIRGLVLPGPDKEEPRRRMPARPPGPVPERLIVVAAHGRDGAVTGLLRQPGGREPIEVVIPPARLAELVESKVRRLRDGMELQLMVNELGRAQPMAPDPLHYVQQAADAWQGPVRAPDPDANEGQGGPRTFVPLRPQLDLSRDGGHLQLISLSPGLRKRADLRNQLRHPWGPLVVEVFLVVFRDGSLGMYYPGRDGQEGRAHPLPARVIAAEPDRELQGRPFVIRPASAAGEEVSQDRLQAGIAQVHALVSMLGGRDPRLAPGAADALAIDKQAAMTLLGRAAQAAAADLATDLAGRPA
jgi:hypothetical protein